MKADITWMRDGVFAGRCGGHTVLMDIPEDGVATTVAPSPMGIMLIAMGGCTSYDVVSQLREAGQDVTDCQVTLQARLQEEDPQIYRAVHLTYTVSGKGLDQGEVERAVQQSQDVYSGALITVGRGAAITSEISIKEAP